MKTKLSVLLLFLISLTACEKENSAYECEAIVLEQVNTLSIQCSKDPISLKFTHGLDRVQSITGGGYNKVDSNYTVVNLPEKLKIPGISIKLNIRALDAGEGPSCYNYEMPLFIGSLVYVVSAEEK